MVVTGGKVVYSYGDLAQACYLASARKSVLSMLYGKYVANGTIELDKTMADLGIDEPDGLLPIEKTAKVRDLLIASSGVYHPGRQSGRRSQQPAARLEGARQVLPLQQLGLQRAGRDLREGDRQDGVRRPGRGAGASRCSSRTSRSRASA